MSHISVIEIEVKSLESLGRAVKRLGGELKIGQTTWTNYGVWMGDNEIPRAWFHTQAEYDRVLALGYSEQKAYMQDLMQHCHHAIAFPDCSYEVGVVRRGEGYLLLADTWSVGGLGKYLGDQSRLKQLYAAEEIKLQAELAGYTYSERENKAGEIELLVNC